MEKIIRVLVVLAGLAVVAILAVRFFVMHPYRIPSGGMSPSFDVASHVVANHFDREPARGKAIVFQFPENRDQDFIQRIIAVGGDKIRVKGGHPWINDWEVPNCRVGKYDHLSEGYLRHSDIFVEFLGEFAFLVAIETSSDAKNDAAGDGTWTVKPGYVFTMGDNRMNSYDSRLWPSQVGVDDQAIWGGVVVSDVPTLPADAKALQPGLDDCLAKRPVKTSP